VLHEPAFRRAVLLQVTALALGHSGDGDDRGRSAAGGNGWRHTAMADVALIVPLFRP
jgi:hypothetical protein